MIVAKNLLLLHFLHKNPGFLSLFPKQSSFWISQNPVSKFPVQLASARMIACPSIAKPAQKSSPQWFLITFFSTTFHQSHELLFCAKSNFKGTYLSGSRWAKARKLFKTTQFGVAAMQKLCSCHLVRKIYFWILKFFLYQIGFISKRYASLVF